MKDTVTIHGDSIDFEQWGGELRLENGEASLFLDASIGHYWEGPEELDHYPWLVDRARRYPVLNSPFLKGKLNREGRWGCYLFRVPAEQAKVHWIWSVRAVKVVENDNEWGPLEWQRYTGLPDPPRARFYLALQATTDSIDGVANIFGFLRNSAKTTMWSSALGQAARPNVRQSRVRDGEAGAIVAPRLADRFLVVGTWPNPADAFRRVVELEDPSMAVRIGATYEARGDSGEAAISYMHADEAGDALGALKLGCMFENWGHLNAAAAAYYRAQERGNREAADKLVHVRDNSHADNFKRSHSDRPVRWMPDEA